MAVRNDLLLIDLEATVDNIVAFFAIHCLSFFISQNEEYLKNKRPIPTTLQQPSITSLLITSKPLFIMYTIPYDSKSFRILVAFFGALYSVLYGRTNEILTALISPGFYLALVFSFFAALFMVNIVYRSNTWLDVYYKWKSKTIWRIILQVLLGLVLPLSVDFIFMTLLFALDGQNILDNGFLDSDFIYIFYLMVLLNVYYLSYFFLFNVRKESASEKLNESTHEPEFKKSRIEEKFSEEITNGGRQQNQLILDYKGIHVELNMVDILCIYTLERKTIIFTKGQERYMCNETISSMEQKLNNEGFCRISKSSIINLEAVSGYGKGGIKNTLLLIAKTKYKEIFKGLGDDKLTVRKVYISMFNKAFTGLQEEK